MLGVLFVLNGGTYKRAWEKGKKKEYIGINRERERERERDGVIKKIKI